MSFTLAPAHEGGTSWDVKGSKIRGFWGVFEETVGEQWTCDGIVTGQSPCLPDIFKNTLPEVSD